MGEPSSGLTHDEQMTALRRIHSEYSKADRLWVAALRGVELECALAVSAIMHGRPMPDPPADGDPNVIELP